MHLIYIYSLHYIYIEVGIYLYHMYIFYMQTLLIQSIATTELILDAKKKKERNMMGAFYVFGNSLEEFREISEP